MPAGSATSASSSRTSEEQWRDANSIDLLRIVIGRMSGAVANVDVTVICEEPKLAPYKAEISSLLTGVLSAPVSVKASTNEGMGAIGRGEGIACMAVALVDTGDELQRAYRVSPAVNCE